MKNLLEIRLSAINVSTPWPRPQIRTLLGLFENWSLAKVVGGFTVGPGVVLTRSLRV